MDRRTARKERAKAEGRARRRREKQPLTKPQIAALAHASRRGEKGALPHGPQIATYRALARLGLVSERLGALAVRERDRVPVRSVFYVVTPAGLAALENTPRAYHDAEGSAPWRGAGDP